MKVIARSEYQSFCTTVSRFVIVCLVTAGLTAICARVSFHLPFTPVPITLQVFAVLLSGLALGSKLGAASQMLYVAIGAAGLPVFADGKGTAAVLGPTGGYIVGFIAAAFVAGLISERLREKATLGAGLGALAGITIIYLFGTSWLAIWLSAVERQEAAISTIKSAWLLGAFPFIVVDLLKAVIAGAIAAGGRRVLTQPY